MYICVVQFLSYALSFLYTTLGFSAFLQLVELRHSAKKSTSLTIYLFCSLSFCFLRAADFLIYSYQEEEVDCSNHEGINDWQWQLLDSGWRKSVWFAILSTLPAPLFFSSYSSFWYSLARVYDSFTRSESQTILLRTVIIMNVSVYASLITYYVAYLWSSPIVSYVERAAEISLAVSALITVSGFILYATLIYKHFQALNLSSENAFHSRLKKLNKNLRFNRLVVVYLTCIFSFSTRAFFLLSGWHLSGWNVFTFFLILEVLPTAAMLYVFWPTASEKEKMAQRNPKEAEQLIPKPELEI